MGAASQVQTSQHTLPACRGKGRGTGRKQRGGGSSGRREGGQGEEKKERLSPWRRPLRGMGRALSGDPHFGTGAPPCSERQREAGRSPDGRNER